MLLSVKKRLLAAIADLSGDTVTVYENDACLHQAGSGERARLYIRDPRFYAALAGGSVKTAEAYIKGWWDASDLYPLMRAAAGNIDMLNARLDGGWRRLERILRASLAAGRRRLFPHASARADIAAHYDLSNEFFSLFLDDTCAYSCAIFPDIRNATAAALPLASCNKLNIICDKLELAEKDTLLDLGCGWGSLAFHAARERGCRITAVTLSAAQQQYLQTREHVSSGQVQAVLCDYRHFQPREKFSKISSVEMIEAAGDKHFFSYFRRLREFLAGGGRAQVQAILIPDARYAAARRDRDFISRYIFPGGALPSAAIVRKAADAAGLRILRMQDISEHYAPTLLAWRERFNAQLDKIKSLGFDEQFCRLWEYYFCYCAGGFAAGAIHVAQFELSHARR